MRADSPTMLICGNDESSKKWTSAMLTEFGWDVADMGAVEAARAIEPLCILWCIPGCRQNSWNHAFRLLSVIQRNRSARGPRRVGAAGKRWSFAHRLLYQLQKRLREKIFERDTSSSHKKRARLRKRFEKLLEARNFASLQAAFHFNC